MQQQPPHRQLQRQGQVTVTPQAPTPRKRFRWPIVIVPGVVLLAIYLVKAVGTALSGVSWNDLLDRLGIVHKDRFTALALLMCVCLAFVALGKILNLGRKE